MARQGGQETRNPFAAMTCRLLTLAVSVALALTVTPVASGAPPASLSVRSTPEARSFSLLSADNVVVRSGKTPATLRELPSGDYEVSFAFRNGSSYFVKAKVGPEGGASVDVDFRSLDKIPLLQTEFRKQAEIINVGAKLAQKVGPPILREMGYLAAKHENHTLKQILVLQKLETFLMTQEQVRAWDEGKSTSNRPATEPSISETKELKPGDDFTGLPRDGASVEYTNAVRESIDAQAASLEKRIDERKALVQQSEATQKQFTDIMTELDKLSKSGDADARSIMDRFGIRVNDPAVR